MSRLSRREFLERSMLATTAALAANTVATPFAYSADNAKGPNEKLAVAVIGAGGRGNEHIAQYTKNPGTEVVCLCDVDEAQAQKLATAMGKTGRKPKVVLDIRKLLEDKSIDCVSITTPNHWHSLAAIWALQAGKDVYVEKPVSHNVWEGRRLVEIAGGLNRICQAGTQNRSNPANIEAVQYVRDGKIGEVKVARGLCYKRRASIGPKTEQDSPSTLNYDAWLGPAPMQKVTRMKFHYDWHWFWDFGNGDLGNQGIHQMDIARWGLDVGMPTSTFSYGGRLGYEDAGQTANTQIVVHDYGSKSLVFEVRGLETKGLKGAYVGVIFEGSEGYVVMFDYTVGAAFDLNGKKVQDFKGGGDHLHFANFVDAVHSRKSSDLRGNLEQAHISSAMCHLGNISYRLGRQMSFAEAAEQLKGFKSHDNNQETFDRFKSHLADNKVDLEQAQIGLGAALTFDPKTETFADNAKANLMLTREYRAPYIVPPKV